jgi:hypothetical protein
MNDSQVTAVSTNTVMQANAYILFYTKTTPTPALPPPSIASTASASAVDTSTHSGGSHNSNGGSGNSSSSGTTAPATNNVRNSLASTSSATTATSSGSGSKYSSASSNDIPSYVVKGATGGNGGIAGNITAVNGGLRNSKENSTNRELYCDSLDQNLQQQQQAQQSRGSNGSQTSRSSHYPYASTTGSTSKIALAKQHSMSDIPANIQLPGAASTLPVMTSTGTNTASLSNTSSTSYLSPFQGLFHTMTNVFRRPSFTLSSANNTPRSSHIQSATQATQTSTVTNNIPSTASVARGNSSGSGKYGNNSNISNAGGGGGGGERPKKKRSKQSVMPVNNMQSANSPYRGNLAQISADSRSRMTSNYRYRPEN